MAQMYHPRIERSDRRTIALQISRGGEIIVKAPSRAPMQTIQEFIESNTGWIEQQLQKFQHHVHPQKHTYTQGDVFKFLGKEFQFAPGNYSTISLKNESLLFPQALLFRAEKELMRWYSREAKQVITQQVNFYSQQMQVQPNGALTFSDTTSQWGRCTHDNRLQFSWRLIMAPLLTLNYVVIHELTHITEKNHSRAFWSRVRLFNPSYRQQILWLKKNGNSLF